MITLITLYHSMWLKIKVLKILLSFKSPLMSFVNVFFGLPLPFVSWLKIMSFAILINVSCDLLYTCSIHLNWFHVIFFSMNVILIFSLIISFCILYYLVWSHIYLNIFIFVTLTFLSCYLFKILHSPLYSIVERIVIW